MNIIDCTIKMKEESHAHYLRLADAVENPDMKRLFTLLASAEAEHITLLKAMSSVIESGAAGLETLEASVCVFRPALDVATLGKALRNDPDAFRHVVAEEEEAIELFDHLAAEADNDRMKRLCQVLAAQERKHLDMIEEIYNFVEQPRTYLEWGEFGNQRSL